MDFAGPVDHKGKIKENAKIDKYLDLAGEVNILWNMRVTIRSFVHGALGTTHKGLKIGERQQHC